MKQGPHRYGARLPNLRASVERLPGRVTLHLRDASGQNVRLSVRPQHAAALALLFTMPCDDAGSEPEFQIPGDLEVHETKTR